MTKLRLPILLAFTLLTSFAPAHPQSATLDAVKSGFAHPPDDARIRMRWWWFGPAVTKEELRRELVTMKAGGIGGAEIQPVYAMELDDPQIGFINLPYLSPEFLSCVSYAAETAHELGLRLDLTLNSGWPYGGSYVPVSEASGMLRTVVDALPGGGTSIAIPSIRNGEKLLAAFVAPGTPEEYDARQTQMIYSAEAAGGEGSRIENGRMTLPAGLSGPHAILFFISSRTGQMVKRAAVGADGFVLDHYSMAAIQDHLKTVGEPLVRAFGSNPPNTIFSDSLEVYDADWTPDMLKEFRQRRGYDLTPYLPALVADIGPKTKDIRYDWARTLNELIDEHYLTPLNNWAIAHHTHFRSQTYGVPAVTLSSNRLVDLPEGEGAQWRSFSFTRWATSASHLYGRPITSSETWTWLHSPAFRATPLDMKAEADTFFLQGINQLVGHGWPYSPELAGDPGWSFYAAAVFNQHNPWWIVMPDITLYLQRMSYLLRQGTPANHVAVLLPTEDAQADFNTRNISVSGQMGRLLGPDIVPALLDSGYDFDFIDSEAILLKGIHYPVLVMPGIERLPLAVYRRILEYEQAGGVVIATGRTPSLAPGLKESATDSAEVQRISRDLFSPGTAHSELIAQAGDLGAALGRYRKPDVLLSPRTPDVGFIERKLPHADIFFLANTGNQPHVFDATFQTTRSHASWWDPFDGKVSDAGSGPTLHFSLAPYESRVVVFSDAAVATDVATGKNHATTADPLPPAIDISSDWKVTFDKTGHTEEMEKLHSWVDDPETEYYSGTATYERAVDIPAGVQRAAAVYLDFGKGTPVERPARPEREFERGAAPPAGRRGGPGGERGTPPAMSAAAQLAGFATTGPGTRAWLDPPVREAAVVYVNGVRAGSVWHPPYRLNIGPLLRPGKNELKIVVANTAINELAGRAAPDYRLLNSRYGERFTPQDTSHMEPLPSGILQSLQLEPAS